MKYYVSYVLSRKNAKPHRFNHGFCNNNKDTRGELVGFVNVEKRNGKYFLTYE